MSACLSAADAGFYPWPFADCLHLLDETTVSGSAAASDVYCNRALVLMQQQPSDNQGALQDSSCAVACNRANCKVSCGD